MHQLSHLIGCERSAVFSRSISSFLFVRVASSTFDVDVICNETWRSSAESCDQMIACLSPSQIIRSRIEDRRNDDEYCCDEDGREINARKNRPSNEFANSTPAHTCTSTTVCCSNGGYTYIPEISWAMLCNLSKFKWPSLLCPLSVQKKLWGFGWPFKAGKFLSCSYIVSTAAALIMALDHERRSHFKTKLENYNVVTPLHA